MFFAGTKTAVGNVDTAISTGNVTGEINVPFSNRRNGRFLYTYAYIYIYVYEFAFAFKASVGSAFVEIVRNGVVISALPPLLESVGRRRSKHTFWPNRSLPRLEQRRPYCAYRAACAKYFERKVDRDQFPPQRYPAVVTTTRSGTNRPGNCCFFFLYATDNTYVLPPGTDRSVREFFSPSFVCIYGRTGRDKTRVSRR